MKTFALRLLLPAIAIGAILGIVAAPSMQAQARGTLAEARAMLAKAVAHYKTAGRKQAFADFNAKKAPFGDRDLYVACISPDHHLVANGGYPSFVGMSVDVLKDADGKPVGRTMWDVASSKGEGSVTYPMLNPTTNKTELKTTFVQKVGDDVCGVGAYNQ